MSSSIVLSMLAIIISLLNICWIHFVQVPKQKRIDRRVVYLNTKLKLRYND